MAKYVGNQHSVLVSLIAALNCGNKFSIIRGPSGSGKSFLLEILQNQASQVRFYRLSGDPCDQMRPYYPFKNLLNDLYTENRKKVNKRIRNAAVHNTINQAGSFSPLGSDAISTCIAELTGAKKKRRELQNISFSRDEIELLFSLDYFCGGTCATVFLADDLQYWDDDSLQLLYTLIKRSDKPDIFLKNALFMATINTSIQSSSSIIQGLEKEAEGHVYLLERVEPSTYDLVLNALGCTIPLSKELISTLYSITGGNLQLTADIVLLLHSATETEETIRQIISKRNLGHLIVERLNRSENDGILINDALKYGSLFGTSFYYHELEPALELQESKIRNLIETAQSYLLVKSMPTGAAFIHELIRETYKREAEDNKIKYYIGFANCLKLLYPGNYAARTKSLFTAGEYEKARVTYLLHYIRELRAHKSLTNAWISNELPTRLLDYANAMKSAYQSFYDEEYQHCLEILEAIEDIYPSPLLAEKYYLLSITLSKWLDTRYRTQAQSCLEPYLDYQYIDEETEIWERILSAYIVACVHNNNIDRALKIENELKRSIAARIDFDMEASFRINTLRRKASSLHPPSVSFNLTRKSKEYFAPKNTNESGGAPLDPVEYYMSLNNYIASALMIGRASDVVQDAEVLIKLPLSYRYLKFPRYEMPLNNAILVAYINDKVSAKEARQALEKILQRSETENTTAVIIRTNIAIFKALQGDLRSAKEELENLSLEISKIENLEFYYYYLVQVNLAAIFYISEQEESCINILTSLAKRPYISSDENFEAHVTALYSICLLNRQNSKEEWYRQPMPFPNGVRIMTDMEFWNYYGKKYLFGELEFWSES